MEHINVNPTYFESGKLEDINFVPQCLIQETPSEYPLEEAVHCHGQWHVCDWQAMDENGRKYAVLVPIE